jgi:hypothetical protein
MVEEQAKQDICVKKAANRVIFMINLKDSEAIKFTML